MPLVKQKKGDVIHMKNHTVKEITMINEIKKTQHRFRKIQRLTEELINIDRCVDCTNNLSDNLLKSLVQSREKEINTRKHNIKQLILIHTKDINKRLDGINTLELMIVGKIKRTRRYSNKIQRLTSELIAVDELVKKELIQTHAKRGNEILNGLISLL